MNHMMKVSKKPFSAYHGSQETKDFFVARMEDHIAQDELIRGYGWRDHKGCAVGCILNEYNHGRFPEALGMPEWVAYLIDRLHENTSEAYWPTFSVRFLKAVQPGQDLDALRIPFAHIIMDDALETFQSLDSQPAEKKEEFALLIEEAKRISPQMDARESREIIDRIWAFRDAAASTASASAYAAAYATYAAAADAYAYAAYAATYAAASREKKMDYFAEAFIKLIQEV